MDEPLDLLPENTPSWQNGVSWPVVFSIVVHTLLIVWFLTSYHPVTGGKSSVPIPRYITLMRQNPDFVEAPGKKTASAPLNAPYSDANRKAASPKPTGSTPSKRPGDGGLYVPSSAPPATSEPLTAQQPPASSLAPVQVAQTSADQRREQNPLAYHQEQPLARAAVTAPVAVDWKNAIREAGKTAAASGGDGGLAPGSSGGEKGFGETGPLSFETQWFDWGNYAESMVSRIRVHWYGNMPPLIRTGMKGVVTIQFTIQRSGKINDVQILKSSGVPPYDFAAKKSIELSSPLNPLPADFPKESERVTCMFFYNDQPPAT